MQLLASVPLYMLFPLPEYPYSHCVLISVLQRNRTSRNKIYVYTEIYTSLSLSHTHTHIFIFKTVSFLKNFIEV